MVSGGEFQVCRAGLKPIAVAVRLWLRDLRLRPQLPGMSFFVGKNIVVAIGV
jgi:hypothetical protein